MATNNFTGVRVVETSSERINQLYADKRISIGKKDFPNSFIVFKCSNQSALTRVEADGETAKIISDKLVAGKLKPRNKEQFMALEILLDPSVQVVTMTGSAGTGKTLLSMAAALDMYEDQLYSRIVLTRPMDPMGQMKELGAMPGDLNEKFGIYLSNFIDNTGILMSSKKNKGQKDNFLNVADQYNLEFIPMQVMRGASFNNTIIIADEIQTLTQKQLLALGTRVGEGSKLILLGDLSQRDSSIKKTATGLYKFINHEKVKNNPVAAHLELIKCERGPVSMLFAETLSDDES